MRKSLFILSFILFSAVVATSCGQRQDKDKASSEKVVSEVQYTCPMHPEIITSSPGDCPICGMDLVEKK